MRKEAHGCVLGVEEEEGRRRRREGGEYLVVKAVKDKHLNQMLRLLDVPRGDFGHAQCAALRRRGVCGSGR